MNVAETSTTLFAPHPHRVTVCPECGGLLAAGKDPEDSDHGYRYRIRTCQGCGAEWGTKQPPEELTGKIEAIIE